ncbi:MAG: hypothetical protein JWM56_49 [Candidatus Peribacteria bacterium]|nr:hypothetical protein [Candidatus Peribacteria bacterium]
MPFSAWVSYIRHDRSSAIVVAVLLLMCAFVIFEQVTGMPASLRGTVTYGGLHSIAGSEPHLIKKSLSGSLKKAETKIKVHSPAARMRLRLSNRQH